VVAAGHFFHGRHAAVDQQHGFGLVFRQADGFVEQRLVRQHLAAARAGVGADDDARRGVVDARGQRAAAKPPNTTEWMAPMRAQASMAKAASGIMGM
jgi:hypothetical protein